MYEICFSIFINHFYRCYLKFFLVVNCFNLDFFDSRITLIFPFSNPGNP
jgi:hypothetical protein